MKKKKEIMNISKDLVLQPERFPKYFSPLEKEIGDWIRNIVAEAGDSIKLSPKTKSGCAKDRSST